VAKPTLVYRLYTGLVAALAPLAFRRVATKLQTHNVAPERVRERLGHATLARPEGPLIWFHAASVGESLSILSLITRLGELHPQVSFLITSGTATSAQLIAQRMPPRCQHQFAPLDAGGVLDRFLSHWHPTGAVIVESELWPQTIVKTHATGIPMVLLNARLSQGSVRNWERIPKTARYILNLFRGIRTQNSKSAENLIDLGADPSRVKVGQNLKSTSAPLPVNADQLTVLRQALQSRPTWVASSTHPGEEDTVLAAHKALLQHFPDLCLILVPRHPERAGAVIDLITAADLRFAQRSKTQPLQRDTQVYLADTLGETGLWYALSPIVFLGGSLLPIGGHNPFEVAQGGAAVLSGPHVTNFVETYDALRAANAVRFVSDAPTMSDEIAALLRDPAALAALQQASVAFVTSQAHQLDAVATDLSRLLQLR
jgi:3-deoxy-D-manno-octulosonic-acid transferase